MKTYNILYSIIIFSLLSACSEKSKKSKSTVEIECSKYLGYDIVRILEKPIWLPDSIGVEFMGHNGFLIIKDCNGNADLILKDKKNNTILTGNFIESDVYKKRKILSTGDPNKDSVLVNIPYINGNWKFNKFIAESPIYFKQTEK